MLFLRRFVIIGIRIETGKTMKLKDLDAIQNSLIATHPHDGYCWNCQHLNGVDGDGRMVCSHPINGQLKNADETVDELIYNYLYANNLHDDDVSDFGVGNHCSLYKYDEVINDDLEIEK